MKDRRSAALAIAPVAVLVTLAGVASGESPPAVASGAGPPALDFRAYLAGVGRSNLALAAQRANVSIADAQVAIARVFPNPVLSAGILSWDVSGVGAQNNVGVGVAIPLEWPGKRPARVAVARANQDVTAAALDDFTRTLRASAAIAFVDALLAQKVLEHRRESARSMERLVESNEERLRTGAVGEIVVLQSRIEARRYRGDVVAAEGEARAARIALLENMGLKAASPTEIPPPVVGDLRVAPRTFDEAALIGSALRRRPDLRGRRDAVRAAHAGVDLAHANRGVDFALNLGWTYYMAGAPGSAFQSPVYHTLNAMVSMALPLSNLINGEVRAARAVESQSADLSSAAELRVVTEVRTALARYEAARQRLAIYDSELLADNDRLLEMARFSFEHGSSRLIELLAAERTRIDSYIGYENALADHARALIALETAVDQWDLSF